MRPDTIFRIASMSKAVTSVAIMMLTEEGKLMLADPVAKHLPAFARTTVATAGPGGLVMTPAKRLITIRDLLTHTGGISYGTGLAADQWKAAGLQGWYLSDKKEPIRMLVDPRKSAAALSARPKAQPDRGISSTGRERASRAAPDSCRPRETMAASCRCC